MCWLWNLVAVAVSKELKCVWYYMPNFHDIALDTKQCLHSSIDDNHTSSPEAEFFHKNVTLIDGRGHLQQFVW